MRIILVQAEIELALRAYVLNQIAVKDGQDISITFKNTRGDDGATAEIDITTPSISSGSPTTVGNEPQKSTQPVKESVSPVQATKTLPKASTASPAPAVEATAPTSTEPEQSVEAASSTTEPTAQVSTEAETPAEESKEEEFKVPSFLNKAAQTSTEEEAPVTKPSAAEAPAPSKSLFANLTKPVNPKPPAEE